MITTGIWLAINPVNDVYVFPEKLRNPRNGKKIDSILIMALQPEKLFGK